MDKKIILIGIIIFLILVLGYFLKYINDQNPQYQYVLKEFMRII